MMKTITVKTQFKMAAGHKTVDVVEGVYAVSEHDVFTTDIASRTVSPRCAEIALNEGWAVKGGDLPEPEVSENSPPDGSEDSPPLVKSDGDGSPSENSGKENQSSSSPPDQVSEKEKSGLFGRKKK